MGTTVDVSNHDDRLCRSQFSIVIHDSVFRAVSQASVDSDIATAFQRRFHISVDDSEQNNVSCQLLKFKFTFSGRPKIFSFFDIFACSGGEILSQNFLWFFYGE